MPTFLFNDFGADVMESFDCKMKRCAHGKERAFEINAGKSILNWGLLGSGIKGGSPLGRQIQEGWLI